MITNRLFFLVSVMVGLLGHSASWAQSVGGGGPKATDCFATFDSVPIPNTPLSKPQHVTCADQDGTCGDFDARPGYCRYGVRVTLNSSTLPPCVPTSIGGFLIPFSGPTLDDHPKNIADFEAFQNFANDNLPLTAADTDFTDGFHNVTVPMTVAFTAKGPFFQTTTLKLNPTTCTTALDVKGHCPTATGAQKDVDTFKLTCTPEMVTDPMTGKKSKVSACTGIASTFQQIQEHIFDRKCSSQATCHGSATAQHDLCLVPSCAMNRSAFTDLIETPTHTSAANSTHDNVLRVVPGDPTNSFLMHKLNGGTQLDSVMYGKGAYGLRMPYNLPNANPTLSRARPKLSKNELQLISDWILAGAPANGFVTTTAKGACQ